MKKRILAAALSLVMLFSMTACGSKTESKETENKETENKVFTNHSKVKISLR